jgi:hypothetical protein
VGKVVNYVRMARAMSDPVPAATKMPEGYDEKGNKVAEKPAATPASGAKTEAAAPVGNGGITINMLAPPAPAETKK